MSDKPIEISKISHGDTTDTCALSFDVQATAAQYHAFGVSCLFTFEDGSTWAATGVRDRKGQPFTAHEPLVPMRFRGARYQSKDKKGNPVYSPIKSAVATVDWAEDADGGVWGNKEAETYKNLEEYRAFILIQGGSGGGGHK